MKFVSESIVSLFSTVPKCSFSGSGFPTPTLKFPSLPFWHFFPGSASGLKQKSRN